MMTVNDSEYKPVCSFLDKDGSYVNRYINVEYMSDGDPFDPKYSQVVIDLFNYRGGETNENETLDKFLQGIVLFFGSKHTTVTLVEEITGNGRKTENRIQLRNLGDYKYGT